MKPFEEYYYIGKPGDDVVLDYYFYKYVALVGDEKKWFDSDRDGVEWDTVLVEGRWRNTPRRHINQEIDDMADYFVIHKDDKPKDMRKYYPEMTEEESIAIFKTIRKHQEDEQYHLDYLIEEVWRYLGLEAK